MFAIDDIEAYVYVPEADILSVLDVPPGKWELIEIIGCSRIFFLQLIRLDEISCIVTCWQDVSFPST